jgi:hypothetical protein
LSERILVAGDNIIRRERCQFFRHIEGSVFDLGFKGLPAVQVKEHPHQQSDQDKGRSHGQGDPHPDSAPPPKSSVTHPRNSR